MSPITYEIQQGIVLITFQNPPVNGMSYALRRGIVESLDKALEDKSVQAVVLTGSDKAFSGGADVTEFGTPKTMWQPNLRAVIEALEESEKIVVAAIQGVCLGGGLELAMGAHYRIAKADAQLGLPEVKLGLLPGAGGTQRLPRAVGLEKAIEMVTNGSILKAKALADTDLVDRVVDDNLVAEAIKFAQELVAKNAELKQLRQLEVQSAGDAQALRHIGQVVYRRRRGGDAIPSRPVLAVQTLLFAVHQRRQFSGIGLVMQMWIG